MSPSSLSVRLKMCGQSLISDFYCISMMLLICTLVSRHEEGVLDSIDC